MKKLIVLILMGLVFTLSSCTEESVEEKFLNDGYVNYSGNFRRDSSDGSTSILFGLIYGESNTYFDLYVEDSSGGYTVWTYWPFIEKYSESNQDEELCFYDMIDEIFLNEIECSTDEIENAISLRDSFNEELENIGITIEDLREYVNQDSE